MPGIWVTILAMAAPATSTYVFPWNAEVTAEKVFRKHVVEKLWKFQNYSLLNVSQLATVPDLSPVVNHRERCADVP